MSDVLRYGRGRDAGQHMRDTWAGIEEEFGEPIRDVILGMRADGWLWRTIAGALGITERQLNNWRRCLGLPLEPHNMKRDPELLNHLRDKKAQARGYKDLADALYDLRAKRWTYDEIAAHLGLSESTIYVNMPEGLREHPVQRNKRQPDAPWGLRERP
jgi:hypothetical protein